MRFFENILCDNLSFKTLNSGMKERKHCLASPVSGVQKAGLIAALCHLNNERAFCAVQNESEAVTLKNDIETMGLRALIYPKKDFTFMNVDTKSFDYEHERIKILSRLIDKSVDVVISTLDAAAQYTMPKSVLKHSSILLKEGLEIPMEELTQKLTLLGYEKTDNVEGTGQFAVRGGILDLFMPDSENPVRIEFFGDEIDTINYFNTESQRRTDYCEEIYLIPSTEVLIANKTLLAEKIRKKASLLRSEKSIAAKELLYREAEMIESGISIGSADKFFPLIYDKTETLFDYLDENTFMFISEYRNIKERNKSEEYHRREEMLSLFEEGILCKGFDKYEISFDTCLKRMLSNPVLFLDSFSHANYDTNIGCTVTFNTITPSPWNGQVSILCEDLDNLGTEKYAVVIMAGTKKNALNLQDSLIDKGYNCEFREKLDEAVIGRIFIMEGTLSQGICFVKERFMLITHSQIQAKKIKKRPKIKNGQSIASLEDLNFGDHVVHASHGIGIYRGVHKISFQNVTKDYIKIEYDKKEILYVPITQLDLVAKYIGPNEDTRVKLSQLSNPQAWQKQKAKVKTAAKEIAKDLIKLYAKRMKSKGYAFSPDSEWQHDFETKFEYEETDDQIKCSSEIKEDMENIVPMDRLLCGDVGFGKTEVALRAAFKCVADNKQCAILCPTTILAWQHYQTIIKRFDEYPVNIDILSRFKSKKENEETINNLKRGKIDIVVGTHRLIQKDVQFADLGLAIIDEEQRFGVAQKEKFKSLKENIDILTLSATPIPRTMNMAMSGIRDMSVIEEAPDNRHPVQTFVLEFDFSIINEAIRKEIRRGGQVFYLYNKVASITEKAYKISRDIPEANVAIAHGQMDEHELNEVWAKMINNEINVLVCTTIIETGVDLQNANTLIIENADRFGLSQLHQIRGRVGRSSRRAYAYFTYDGNKVLTEISQKRLQAIREYTEFGSGFKIAMRDLELRGAGNILGAQQHGHLGDVGYDMYLKILAEAVNEEKGIMNESSDDIDCLVDISINAYIPESYIESLNNRLEIYRMIASIRSDKDKKEIMEELVDRFGSIPKSVMGLIDIALIRSKSAKTGIYEIKQKDSEIMLFVKDIKDEKLISFIHESEIQPVLKLEEKPYLSFNVKNRLRPLDDLKVLYGI